MAVFPLGDENMSHNLMYSLFCMTMTSGLALYTLTSQTSIVGAGV